MLQNFSGCYFFPLKKAAKLSEIENIVIQKIVYLAFLYNDTSKQSMKTLMKALCNAQIYKLKFSQ